MRKLQVLSAALLFSVAYSSAAFAQKVELKADPECIGPSVTLGDLFVNAGAVASRAIAPAPASGAQTTFSARFLAAAASAAGLEWTPPAGIDTITVTRPGVQRAAFTPPPAATIAIKRGDIVTLTYSAPGLTLTTRARAMGDARSGQPVKLINLQSNKPVDAVVTGPGSASASGLQSF